MRAEAEKAGLGEHFDVDSAGTHRYHIGEPPDGRAMDVARSHGVSMQGLMARHVTQKDFKTFDLIIAMDTGHYDILNQMVSEDDRAQLKMFSDYCQKFQKPDVPDPYYGNDKGFETMFDILEDGVQGILEQAG